jgi:hypothetical protein
VCEGDSCDTYGLVVAPDGAGGALALWWPRHPPRLTEDDLIATRILASGERAPGWPGIGLDVAVAPLTQWLPKVCTDGVGGYFVVWNDGRNVRQNQQNSWDIYAQRLRADGMIAPGWPVNGIAVCQAIGWQFVEDEIVPDGAGGFYATWEQEGADGWLDVWAQRIAPDGNPAPGWPMNGIPVCVAPGTQEAPVIASDGAGGAFITWPDERRGVYVQHIRPEGALTAGSTADGLLLLDGYAAGEILADGHGGAFVLASKRSPTEFEWELYVLRVRADGELDSAWLRNGLPIPITVGIGGLQQDMRWTLDGLGGLYLRWYDDRDYGTSSSDLYLQHLQSNGDRVPGWPAWGLRMTDWPGWDLGGGIVGDGQGGVYVAYARDAVTHAIRYNYDGSLAPGWPYGGVPVVPPPGRSHAGISIVPDSLGGAIVGWEEIQPSGVRHGYLMKLVPDGIVATSVALASAHATPERVRLAWSTEGNAAVAFTIERRKDGDPAWSTLTTLFADGTGQLAYEDRDVAPGTRYGYRLSYTDERGARVTPEAWVDVPARVLFALHGAAPNPARAGDVRVRLSLGATAPARLSLHDLAGRAVTRLDLAADDPGTQVVGLPAPADLAPGLYWLVLEQGRDRATARVTLLR